MKQLFKSILFVASLLYFANLYGQQKTINDVFEKGRQFKELSDSTADRLIDWSGVKQELQVSFASIDQRFAKHRIPAVGLQTETKLTGWRGERVSAQLLLWGSRDYKNIAVTIRPFKNAKTTLPKDVAFARFVRYVMTDEFGPGCGHRKPEDFAASLSPDMLDDLVYFDYEKNTVRPVWITVNIPREAVPGNYQAAVHIKSNEKTLKTLLLNLEVRPHTLPPPAQWTYHLDFWQHPSAVARVNDLELWSDAHFRRMRPVMKRLADAGQKVITATLNKDPWNVQTYDPYADMIIWTKNQDDSWTYDYTVFDRWISFMLSLGINKMINAYSIIPWNNEIHYKNAATGKFVDVKAVPGTAAFIEMWTPFLKDFSKHLRAKGWLEITNIAMDERSPEQMDAAFDLLKKVAPELGISYADNHKTYRKYPNSEDISISIGHPFSSTDLEMRRGRGLNSTFYTCCSDPFPNQFTFSDPAESVYVAWFALANGFDGMLRWAYNSWVKNPLQDSRFRTWPAGDTYIVYPQNRSSIRFERLREGIQDYEKARIIIKALKEKNDTKGLRRLNQAIEKLASPHRTPDWNKNLNTAKSLLNSF